MTQSIMAIGPANWGRGRTKEYHFPPVALLRKTKCSIVFSLEDGEMNT